MRHNQLRMSALDELMESCENCCREFPQSKIPTHFRYCRLNFIRCEECSLMYDRHLSEEHRADYHRLEKCQHCSKKFTMSEVKQHEEECEEKKKYCEYCDLKVPVKIFGSHFKICEARTKTCDRCRQPISNKDYQLHVDNCSIYANILTKPLPHGFVLNRLSHQRRSPFQYSSNSEEEDSYSDHAADGSDSEEDEQLNHAILMSMKSQQERPIILDATESSHYEQMMADEHFLAEQRAIEEELTRSKK